MKHGEVYGVILRQLNKGQSSISLPYITSVVEGDSDDVEEAVSVLHQQGIVRKINQKEYELVCDIGQLRDFVLSCGKTAEAGLFTGEYNEFGDTPITLEDIENDRWQLYVEEKKAEEKKGDPFSAFERHRRERRRHSYELEDDDDDEDDGIIKLRVKGYLGEMNGYDPDTKSFEPEMRICFPSSDRILRLEWDEDSDGDLFLTDRGSYYEYLLERLGGESSQSAKEMADYILVDMERRSSFGKDGHKLINYLTDVKNRDRLRIEVNYYAIQFGKHLKEFDCILKHYSQPCGDINNLVNEKINTFVEEFKPEGVKLQELIRSGGAVNAVLYAICLIHPSITREQAQDTAYRLSLKHKNKVKIAGVGMELDSLVSQILGYSDRSFNMIKIDAYLKSK